MEGRQLGNRALSWTEKRNNGLIRKEVILFVYLIKRKTLKGKIQKKGNSCAQIKVKVLVAQSRPTLCNPMDGSPPGSSVHGIPQARILEWVAIPFSRESSYPRD